MHEIGISRLHYGHQCIDADALERDLRALEAPWLGDFPSLRLACVLLYAGLMLTLSGLSMSASAAPPEGFPATAGQRVSPQVAVDCHFPPARTPPGRAVSIDATPDQHELVMVHAAMPLPGSAALGFLAGFGVAALLFGGLVVQYRSANLGLRGRLEQSRAELAAARARVDELSRSDALTGIANEQRMRHYLVENWHACVERGVPMSALRIDPDRFRSFNEGCGRELGDRALRALALSLSRQVAAAGGLLARVSGAEFVALLPGSTADEVEILAERLREAVIALEFRRPEPETGFLTASLGAATLVPAADLRPEDLLVGIDRAVAEARRLGGNRVAVECRQDDAGRRLRAC